MRAHEPPSNICQVKQDGEARIGVLHLAANTAIIDRFDDRSELAYTGSSNSKECLTDENTTLQ